MAERRMFAKSIVDSDFFLEMPAEAQLLYFHLSMRADDDGFITPRKVMRAIGAKEDSLKLLIAKKYLIPFESGVVVIRHWRINNYLRSDRYTETEFYTEKNMLSIENNIYKESMDEVWYTNGTPDGIPLVSPGKDRLGKSITESSLHSLSSPTSQNEIGEEAARPGVFIEIPIFGGGIEHVSEEYVQHKVDLFPELDVRQEIRKAVDWLHDNPRMRKKNWKRFLGNWLARAAQQKGMTARKVQVANLAEMEKLEDEYGDRYK